jgi:hypothetical protein
MRIVLASSALALLLASAAAAQNPVPNAASPPVKKDDGSKIVCKSEEFVGSRIPKRICMSQSQWEQGRSNAREIMDERQMWKPTKGKGGG